MHCAQARSRSPTVVLGYLVTKVGLSLKDAYELVNTRNGGISPNGAFKQQLRDLECRVRDLMVSTLPVAGRSEI